MSGVIAGCGFNGVSNKVNLHSLKFNFGDICNPNQDDIINSVDAICSSDSKGKFKIVNLSLSAMPDEVGYDRYGETVRVLKITLEGGHRRAA